MIKQNIIFMLIFSQMLLTELFFIDKAFADNDLFEDQQIYNIKELKASGKISSLESILDKLSEHNIIRLLEIELKQDVAHHANHPFIYEIEYINDKNFVLEIEVDAVTAQVLSIEREH
ncbi:MAG: hypothetical protein KZQ83_01495 [gamma proteobacterium symbiont of Taylorina sp.]|nr:hypothetical protein [gamma proteobacterium symbiont of Taylorina sp.]